MMKRYCLGLRSFMHENFMAPCARLKVKQSAEAAMVQGIIDITLCAVRQNVLLSSIWQSKRSPNICSHVFVELYFYLCLFGGIRADAKEELQLK